MNVSQIIRLAVRDIPDFPKKGILFKDITPVLKDPKIFKMVLQALAEMLQGKKIRYIAGIESRGFLFGAALASELGLGFIPIRKKGKLPYKTIEMSYALEYGEASIEIHEDAVTKGDGVAIVDDLLATGGTAEASVKLIEKLGGKVEAICFVIELVMFKGREKLSSYDVRSLIQY